MQEDLHTICTCSASFLHTSELPCCETRPKAAGGVGGLPGCPGRDVPPGDQKSIPSCPSLEERRGVTSAGVGVLAGREALALADDVGGADDYADEVAV